MAPVTERAGHTREGKPGATGARTFSVHLNCHTAKGC